MKVQLILLCSLGALICSAPANADDSSDEIRHVLDRQVAAWNRGYIDEFMQGYARSENTTFVSGDEVTHGWQTVRDRYARKYSTPAQMGTLTFSNVTITPLCNDAAMILGSWSLARAEDHPHGKFTLLFRRLADGWRIVLDHTS